MRSLGYELFTGELTEITFEEKKIINTLNQYCYCMAECDSVYKHTLQHSDILLPDGVSIVRAVKFLYGKKIKKIAGADLHQYLLQQLNKTGGSCFYLGSSENTLQKIKNRATREYPSVRVGTYSPPFKNEFSEADNAAMIEAVNKFQPDVLFIGMTAPKQEKWAFACKAALNAKVICSIGAVFAFYAQTVKRPHKFWISLGLEWFIRLIKEPKRMWRRYLYYGPVFFFDLLKNKFNGVDYSDV
jgi:N-acetylglucosaminyldiphosphoundecaprenol N-acetyl-beta-D-mannosaminyltransferase